MQLYEHSGRLGKWGVVWAVAWGLFVGMLLSRYYVRALCWMPLVYVNILLAAVYGFAVGAATAIGAKLGHMRNPTVATFLAIVNALLAVYFAWVYTPAMRIGVFEGPVWDFETLWEYVALEYQQGSWSLWPMATPVAGPLLMLVWIGEAALIVATAALTVHRWLVDAPYCEETEQWMKREKNLARLALVGDAAQSQLTRLMEGDFSVLGELARAGGGESAVLQLELASREECSFCKFLTITLIESAPDSRGRHRRQATRLLRHVQISAEELAAIRLAGGDRTAESPHTDVDSGSAKQA